MSGDFILLFSFRCVFLVSSLKSSINGFCSFSVHFSYFFPLVWRKGKLIALDKNYGIILSRVGGHGLVLNPGSKANSEYSTHLL